MPLRLINPVLSLFAILGGLLLSEAVLRWCCPHNHFYIWPPHIEFTVEMTGSGMPGLEGVACFTTNSEGIRGEEFSESDTYRILALGGSTTECAVLDDTEHWPHLLQQKLNAEGEDKWWIGNAGRSGHHAADHWMQIRHFVSQYPEIDAVLLMVGVNDMLRRLNMDEQYFPAEEEPEWMGHSFSLYPRALHKEWYKRTEIWMLLKDTRRTWLAYRESRIPKKEQMDMLHQALKKRRSSRQQDSLPDLNRAVDNYRKLLEKIIRTSKEQGLRLILLTQAALWKADMSPHEYQLLWMGQIGAYDWQGENIFYTPGALARALDLYNRTLIETAEKHGIEYIDLAALLPRDTTVFYDDCHFNEQGAEKVAEVLIRMETH